MTPGNSFGFVWKIIARQLIARRHIASQDKASHWVLSSLD